MKQIYLQSYFKSGYNRLMKYISDIAHLKVKDQQIVRDRLKIIEFFDRYGLKPTVEAFGKKRSTIFLWKEKLKKRGGRLSALRQASKAPKTRSKRVIQIKHLEFIENYRSKYPGVSKETIYPELLEYCLKNSLPIISESTIGRIIKELKEKGVIPAHIKLSYYARTDKFKEKYQKKAKKQRRKDYQPEKAGDLIQIDAIEIFIFGLKRYILTAIDVEAKFAFAYAYKTLSSEVARDFMTKLIKVAPFTISHIQTDNGKEFHKFFRDYVQSQSIIHFYNYPKCPKMNCFIENFNGLIQRQFICWHTQDLRDEIENFNIDLINYLIWYNTKKQHSAIGKIPPLRYYLNSLGLSHQKSNMLWTSANI